MAAAWFALFGTLAGVVATFLGTAVLQSEQRTATRRDAAVDREAANLRDLQQAVNDFARVWGPIIYNRLQGVAAFDPMDPSNADGVPGKHMDECCSSPTERKAKTFERKLTTGLVGSSYS